jgi:phosphoribosylformimino-5-aminoimidazole carboxamide ribotide isomerase
MGARLIHLVDFGGARAGVPVETEAIGSIASRVAVPIQVAGGLASADAIRLVFAAGATRVVLGTDIADQPDELRACLSVAGDWLAVGLDPRPERLAAYPWRRASPPTVETLVGELVGAGVGRFVLTHGGAEPDLERVRSLVRTYDAEILLAGGVRDLDGLRRSREAGVAGVILGEALMTGAIDYPEALAAAA